MAPKREVKPLDDEDEADLDHLDGSESSEDENAMDDAGGADSDVEEEEEDAEPAGDEPPRKKAKKDYSLPSAEELIRVKETEDLFKNNLFRLEIEEMLKEVEVDPSKTKPLEAFLKALKGELDAMPEAEVRANDVVRTPGLAMNKTDKDVFLTFRPPSALHLVGSYLLRTVTKPVLNIDIALDIPNSCFLDKDLLDNRYHNKRSMYLHHIAAKLQKSKLVGAVDVSGFHGDNNKPVLVVTPSDQMETNRQSAKFAVRLYPMINDDVFKLARLGPDRNNLRLADSNQANTEPTPFYNNSILEDMFFRYHLEYLHQAMADCPTLVQAVAMMKVWLRRRHLSQARDGINGFEVSMLMAHLFYKRKINKHMSAYQNFKVTLEFLRSTDLSKGPVVACKPRGAYTEAAAGIDIDVFEGVFDVTLLDPSHHLNLLGRMSHCMYVTLRDEARLSLAALNDNVHDGFETLFVSEWLFFAKFDNFVRVNYKDHAKVGPKLLRNRYHDYPFCIRRDREVTAVLARGLGNRTTSIATRTVPVPRWALSATPPTEATLTLGLCLNPEATASIVDQGPPADDDEKAAAFRELWGSRSELRRFKDGAIVEAVVWEEAREQKHNIVQFATKFLLAHHCSLPETAVTYISSSMEGILNAAGLEGPTSSSLAVNAYHALSKQIRSVDDLPLSIRTITAMSPALRQTDVYPPAPNMNAGYVPSRQPGAKADVHRSVSKCIEPLEVLMEFESSSRWPDTLPAIQHAKAAFYLKLASSLEELYGVSSVPSMDYIDIIFAGFVFRILIFYEGELYKLRKSDAPKAATMERQLVYRPRHAAVINGLVSRFPGYSPTVRLAKRWVFAHLFGDALCEEAVELMCAYIFVSPRQYDPPHTGFCGFMRFLDLVRSFDWENQPLVVDMDHELNTMAYTKISELFHSKPRANIPSLYIVTNRDRESQEWTRTGPNPQMMDRLKLYAAKSLGSIVGVFEGAVWPAVRTWDAVFTTPTNIFDFVVRLAPEKVPTVHMNPFVAVNKTAYDSKKYKNIGGGVRDLLIGFDPVGTLVAKLNERYEGVAMFFYDHHGGTAVYGTWRPRHFLCNSFKVAAAQGTLPLAAPDAPAKAPGAKPKQGQGQAGGGAMEVVPNVFEFISDVAGLGTGLVERVVMLPRC